jgi:hypothetical protein
MMVVFKIFAHFSSLPLQALRQSRFNTMNRKGRKEREEKRPTILISTAVGRSRLNCA